jgi:hypothetical protein
MNTATSKFDSGKRSEINGLPLIEDITRFIENLLLSSPNTSFTRLDLIEAVTNEFNIPSNLIEMLGPDSSTPLFNTRMNYIISDAIHGERENHFPGAAITGKPWAKRVALGQYQHITGNGTALKTIRRTPTVSIRLVRQAAVSVRILKKLNHDPETIMVELGNRIWNDDVIEAAINLEFSL